MAIYRLLQSATFGPEEISLMTGVYEDALTKLAIDDRNHPLTEIIALRIIEFARRGEIDRAEMLRHAIQGIDPFTP